MEVKYYSGIGSRETPPNILDVMVSMANSLSSQSFVLRSGGAKGADSAFALGAKTIKEVYRASNKRSHPEWAWSEAYKLVETYHPNPKALKPYVWDLHARNCFILLGPMLDEPSEFVICWTPKGLDVGGTGLGIRVAQGQNIPVINLGA